MEVNKKNISEVKKEMEIGTSLIERDYKDDEKYYQDFGTMRFIKRRHELEGGKDIVGKKSMINEKFIEKVKECRISGKELKFLCNLVIKQFNPVLPQHKIEHQAGSRIPSPKEKEEFEKICKIKNGPFSSEEDNIIIKNWRKFCEVHDWDHLRPAPFLYLRFGGKSIIRFKNDRIKFVQILASGLPDRTLYSVYHRFRNLYTGHKVGRFSVEEDNIILEHMKYCTGEDEKVKLSILAKLLSRTRMSIWRRYSILNRNHKRPSKPLKNKNTIAEKEAEESEDSTSDDSDSDTAFVEEDLIDHDVINK